MARKARKQTPGKTKPLASGNEMNANLPQKGLGGDNPRGEVAGCPTGLASNPQAQQPQQPGGGAPGTGTGTQPQDRELSSGKDAIEEEVERSDAKY